MQASGFKRYLNWFWAQTRGDDHESLSLKFQILGVMLLLTSTLMWSYTLVAFIFVSPFVGMVGLTCSIVHTLSPLLYRWTKSMPFTTYVFVGAGYVFQVVFSYHTGGFLSPTMMWLAVHPVIVAVLTNKRHSLLWAVISVVGLVTMCWLDLNSPAHQNLLNKTGLYTSQIMATIGLVILNCAFSVFLIEMGYFYHAQIQSKNLQIKNLIRTLTHDLANPLSLVYLKNENIMNGKSKDPVEDAKKMKRALESIRSMLDHARDLDAIEQGKVNLKFTEVSLAEIKDLTDLIFSERKKEKSVGIDWSEFCGDIKIKVDKAAFSNQVFNNLVSNALKFSFPDSMVKISAKVDGANVIIKVSDRGMGIHPNIMSRIFDSFSPTTTVGTNGEKGTGFGILLCKSYLEKMSGTLKLKSQHHDLHPEDHWTEVEIQVPRV